MRDDGGAKLKRTACKMLTPIEPPAKWLSAHFPHLWGKQLALTP